MNYQIVAFSSNSCVVLCVMSHRMMMFCFSSNDDIMFFIKIVSNELISDVVWVCCSRACERRRSSRCARDTKLQNDGVC
jgi:hypothetical protein